MQKSAPPPTTPLLPLKKKACYKWWCSVGLTGALVIFMNVIDCEKIK